MNIKKLILIGLLLSACTPVCKAADESAELKKNRIQLLAGVGPGQDFSIKTSNGQSSVKSNLGFVYGIGYERRVESTSIFVGGQLQNNGTLLLSIGKEF